MFKLQGEVNSVKNTTMNIWLNDGGYCFGLQRPSSGFDSFLPIRVICNIYYI